MKIQRFLILILLAVALVVPSILSAANSGDSAAAARVADPVVEKSEDVEKKLDPKEIIFEHLGDGYGWEVPFNHHKRIPLPVIVFGKDGLHIFSSSRVAHGQTYKDGNAKFKIAGKDSPYKGKIVEILPDGSEYKPWDISITKNVCALFIACILVIWSALAVARWYARKGFKAPRKGMGMIEALVDFIYTGVIRPTLGDRSPKFAPYLLTVFFLILYLNLMGLLVVFPGGANLTGNIAVTMVLALFTFLATNIFGTKHYWKEILWPDVPLWLKFPLPIMPLIELFGIFTNPAALTVRLFANMMGGHMIVIALTLLIFIFGAFGAAVAGATSVFSVCFSVFMLLIDVLVSFIQAYVFTMLSTIFIGFGQEREHEHHEDKSHPEPSATTPAN
ncbi:MAG: F0F1 ATP synthase subunit A [Paramuribaculum sp.]|nr:F0F1 ATP synthase subunit A [Paramuribaculum sp.]